MRDSVFLYPNSFPSTRYQGSKTKLAGWIIENINKEVSDFDTVLDAFAGTGIISHFFKRMGKSVTCNDNLQFNYIIGKALIENSKEKFPLEKLTDIFIQKKNKTYDNLIERNFVDIYYTMEENKWLDIVVQNILDINNEYIRSLAFFALFQACIIKRPFNLFHRKNLYMRTAAVDRSFGNKTTWDRSFPIYFEKFLREANAAIFDNKKIDNRALNKDVFDLEKNFDLVYIDPPYLSNKGIGVDYRDYYHFLEGMSNYYNWESEIDFDSKHLRLKRINDNNWSKLSNIKENFEKMVKKFSDSILVISYRTTGIPSIEELKEIIESNKTVTFLKEYYFNYQYVLSKSTKKENNYEILLIAK